MGPVAPPVGFHSNVGVGAAARETDDSEHPVLVLNALPTSFLSLFSWSRKTLLFFWC